MESNSQKEEYDLIHQMFLIIEKTMRNAQLNPETPRMKRENKEAIVDTILEIQRVRSEAWRQVEKIIKEKGNIFVKDI